LNFPEFQRENSSNCLSGKKENAETKEGWSRNNSAAMNIYIYIYAVAAVAKSLQSCPTLCDPRDGSPPGSAVPGILQARTVEWVASSFSIYIYIYIYIIYNNIFEFLCRN